MRHNGSNRHSNPRYWVIKQGSLYARLQYTDEYGKKREKYKKIERKIDARSAAEAMRAEMLRHGSDALQSDRFTFADLADKYSAVRLAPAVYINGLRVSGRKECSSLKSAVKALRQHFGKKPIRLIKASDIENYKNVRIATPVITLINEFKEVYNPKTKRTKTVKEKVERHRARSIASVNRELQQFKAMLNFAIQNDWLIMNPFAKCKGIISTALETKRDRVLSYEEEERMLQACLGRRSHLRPILICALDTGMRRGEIFQMKWKDVDLSSRQIYIPQTNTKTQTARTVGITDRLKKELLRLWERSPKRPELIVFGISADVKNAWKSALQDADIENFRFHDCRHTATTRMIASGCHHTEVMKITGHSQMVTFLRYLNITPETAQRVADRLGNYLSNRSEISLDTPMSDYVN